MTVYTVIVHYNTPHDVLRITGDLADCTERPHQIIVVDNLSDRNNLLLLKEGIATISNAVLLEQPVNGGFGYGVNRAVDYISQLEREAYIHVLNSDVELVNRNYLTSLCNFLDNNTAVSMVGPMVVEGDGKTVQNTILPLTSISSVIGFKANYSAINQSAAASTPIQVSCLNGVCFVIRMTDYIRIKGFDERYFMYNEEQDLCFKLKKANRAIFFIPVSSVMHAGADLHQSEKTDWRFLYKRRNIVLFLRIHKNRFQALTLAAVFSVSSIGKFIRNPGGVSWAKFVKVVFSAAL
ncbi:glycosyltransferase family 2 protein [Flavihumibacter sp. CACIAM 22H1]|uniref:glycosyltransferase family 2 protein n=1 Tax=Flavihumibacter sp. CACIAM 22H1 TaxID=1812911 RepID=UPI0007A844BE|nr:glycosyltransferase family 2 protein [Flavihumibacter sp. CACIAM 22H1]KYP15143.1 MAG: hypothetical protein A1D16_12625 [Flavihumibacter sp. CACIAM 22H1]